MNPYLEKLQAEMEARREISVLEVLFRCYRELHPADSQAIRHQFSQLNRILEKLTLGECDQVWDLACSLCSEHERAGFQEGLCVGVELTRLLSDFRKTPGPFCIDTHSAGLL